MDKDDQIKPWLRNIVSMAIVFDANDNCKITSKYDGIVTLTKQTWEEHILPKHPEVELNWEHIAETLKEPDNAVAEGDSRIYYKEFPLHQVEVWNQEITAPAEDKWFTVVVQISNKFVLSIYEKFSIPKKHQQ